MLDYGTNDSQCVHIDRFLFGFWGGHFTIRAMLSRNNETNDYLYTNDLTTHVFVSPR